MNRSELDFIFNKFDENIIFVSYEQGYAGHLTTRVISASPEIYFKSNPVKYPDDTEGFAVVPKHESYFTMNHMCTVDIDGFQYSDDEKRPLENTQNEKKFVYNLQKNRIFVLPTHRTDIHQVYKNKVIRLVGSFDRPEIIFRRLREPLEPVYHDHVLNIEINKLVSKDFDVFLKEYLKMCWWLKITPQINNVRAFILLWTEKQKKFKEIGQPVTFLTKQMRRDNEQ